MSGVTKPFDLPTLADGSPNPEYVDMLGEDEPISGLKYFIASFVSPEKVIQTKDQYIFEQFLKYWDITTSMSKFQNFLNFIAYKHSLNIDTLMGDMDEFVKDPEESVKLNKSEIQAEYKFFVTQHEDKLDEGFKKAVPFTTSTRGLKVRWAGNSLDDAKNVWVPKFKTIDSKKHNILIGEVGKWVSFDPNSLSHENGNAKNIYDEPELNKLMQEYYINQEETAKHEEERRADIKRKMIEENVKKAMESRNVLSQTIDKDGNLVSTNQMLSDDKMENLLDTDDVVMDKNNDHGVSRLVNKQLFEDKK